MKNNNNKKNKSIKERKREILEIRRREPGGENERMPSRVP